MNKKLLVRGTLGLLGLLLAAGMVVQYTGPGAGGLNFGAQRGTPALKVNGTIITAQDLERVRQGNEVLSLARDGVLGEDFKTVIVDQKIRETLLADAAKSETVPRKEVNDQVQQIRTQNNLTKNRDWTERLSALGYTDASFREQLRSRLAIEKKAKEIQDAAPKASDAEAQLYYDLHPEAFKSEARIVGRAIVVSDQKKAQDLLAQAKGGADFAQLASANSLENKDRGGALGQIENGKIRPVTSVALPEAASKAAFALTSGGLTDVVKSGDKYYIVKVEQFVPAGPKPFAEAKNDALQAVAGQKKNAAVEKWLGELEAKANVQVLDKNWDYYNPVVANVAGQNVRYAEVLTTMLGNPQFGQFIQQGGDQAAQLVNGFFKPQVLTSIIESYGAQAIVNDLKLPLAGSRQEMLASLQSYGGRDAKVSDAEVRQAYEAQKQQFSTPAKANVSQASFRDRKAALAFRDSFVKSGGDFTAAASKAGGAVSELGEVTAGDGKLGAVTEKAVFGADRLAPAGEGSLSDVAEVNGRYSVAYVTDLVKATAQPLSAVEGQLREQLLQQKRASLGQAFVQAQLKKVKVDNKLDTVLKAVEKRAAQNTPAAPKAPAGTDGKNGGAQPDASAKPETSQPAGTADK